MTAEARDQFRCEICDEAFDQRSRYERHMATSHPPRAPSAADLEQALAGIDFPGARRQLLEHASRRLPPHAELLRLIRTLPDRDYRDAAEVAVALGEVKRRRRRGRAAVEPPSRKGGRVAATAALSAAAIAKVLAGIEFPRSKPELAKHARKRRAAVVNPGVVLDVIDRLPTKRYRSMADVAREVGKIL
jgi:hypothetical protein